MLFRVPASGPPIPTGDPASLKSGDELTVFDIESSRQWTLARVTVKPAPLRSLGSFLTLAPALAPESVGGPLVNYRGEVLGIVVASPDQPDRSRATGLRFGLAPWPRLAFPIDRVSLTTRNGPPPLIP